MIRRLLLSITLAVASSAASAGGPLPFLMTPFGQFAPASCSPGTPVATNIGTASSASGATVTLTGVTAPAGSLIVVWVFENGGVGTVSDGTNTYTELTLSARALFYASNATLSGGTITYTKHGSSDATVMTAFVASHIQTSSPLDTAVTATTSGSGSSVTITSGTPAQSGELFVGLVTAANSATFTETQDTGHGWANPPNSVSLSASPLFILASGGTQVNSGTGTKTFTPTFSASVLGSTAAIVGFQHC